MKQWSTRLSYLSVISYFSFTIIYTMQVTTSTQQIYQDTLDQQLRTTSLRVTKIKAVDTLLAQGANPLAVNSDGNNCFHLLVQAAGRGERRNTDAYIPLIRLLFSQNKPSVQQIRHDNALRNYLVEDLDMLDIIYPKDLINIIAQFANHYPSSQQNTQGETPLHIIFGSPTPNTNLAKLFIESGFICINIKDIHGHFPGQCPRPTLSPQQVLHYDKTKAEIVAIIEETRNP